MHILRNSSQPDGRRCVHPCARCKRSKPVGGPSGWGSLNGHGPAAFWTSSLDGKGRGGVRAAARRQGGRQANGGGGAPGRPPASPFYPKTCTNSLRARARGKREGEREQSQRRRPPRPLQVRGRGLAHPHTARAATSGLLLLDAATRSHHRRRLRFRHHAFLAPGTTNPAERRSLGLAVFQLQQRPLPSGLGAGCRASSSSDLAAAAAADGSGSGTMLSWLLAFQSS